MLLLRVGKTRRSQQRCKEEGALSTEGEELRVMPLWRFIRSCRPTRRLSTPCAVAVPWRWLH